jgi:hypothetical protein
MTSSTIAFPSVNDDDTDDVRDAIDTGFALWHTGEKADAIRWLRRARDFADDAGNDRRALELARVTADLNSILSPVVAPTSTISTESSLAPAFASQSFDAKATSSPSVSSPSVSATTANLSMVSAPPNSSSSGEQRRSKLPEPTAVVRKFTGSTEFAPTSPLQSVTKSQPKSATLAIDANPTSAKPPSATASLRPPSVTQRVSSVPQPQKQEAVTAESNLISVCVRIGSRDIDGSFRVYPAGTHTSVTTATQGILVLSEKLWSTLERR